MSSEKRTIDDILNGIEYGRPNVNIHSVLNEIKEEKPKEKESDEEEDEDKGEENQNYSPDIQSHELMVKDPPSEAPKRSGTNRYRRRGDIKIPEPVASVGKINRTLMGSSSTDALNVGMVVPQSNNILTRMQARRERQAMMNSYVPFKDKNSSHLAEEFGRKISRLLNKPEYKKQLNSMRKEIQGD